MSQNEDAKSNQTGQNAEVTSDPTQNLSSTYYRHPSDSASNKLVSIVFDGTCFNDWKSSMMISLDAKKKTCFVDGSLPKPKERTIEEKAWKRCNNMVTGWFIASLERQIAKGIMYFKTATTIWADFEGRFGNPFSSQMYRFIEQLLNKTQEPELSIAEYFTKVKSLWDEIDDLRPLPTCIWNPTNNFIKIQQDQRILTFLMKLDQEYSQVRSNLLMHKDLPNVTKVYRMLLQEEYHKGINRVTNEIEPIAFATEKWRSPQARRSTNNAKKPSYYWEYCKIAGHSINRCFQIHGCPNKNKNQGRKYIALVFNDEIVDENSEGNPLRLTK
ncbi:unnamed protein product [Amaranthus hypochondriacus]